MNVQHTEYQQTLQTSVTDNNKVHILYPAPNLLMTKKVAPPK